MMCNITEERLINEKTPHHEKLILVILPFVNRFVLTEPGKHTIRTALRSFFL